MYFHGCEEFSVNNHQAVARPRDWLLIKYCYSGLWYVNLHSDAFNGGEIRGQISVVPVPAAAWLFVSGLGMLGWMRRRQLS